jgi:hypothetical protein
MSIKKNDPTYVDLLDEDKPVSGQKFTCISFITPNKILKRKEVFLFEEFLKHWDFSKSLQKFTQFLNFISHKYDINFDKIMVDFNEYVKTENDTLTDTNVGDDYKNFLDAKEDELEKKFLEENEFQTNVNGIKVRGSYPSQHEAELRCKVLRDNDPSHDIFVGPVGQWIPWEPDAYRTGKIDYLEGELNQLMNEKNKNEESAKNEFENRVKEAKRTAIKENIENAKKSGNKLTQNIDAEGNLIGSGISTVENSIKDNEIISSADIRKELFEGDDIRTKYTDSLQNSNQTDNA